ncbi:MAG: serine/threonine protein kinase [Bacteroidia bacterium]|nr:serine/threonine protein kinase [Bacteroidia bacterium]
MTGEKILNYKIENFTDENRLFRSFLATHTYFSKKVIVKTLKPLDNFQQKAEFIDEIQRLSHIQHPNVVTLYDHLETANEFYLIFEHVEGRSLADYIQNTSGPIPEEKTQLLLEKILDAFALAHQNGIMNGVVSASNIIITPDENVKVLDLALSKFYRQIALSYEDREALSFASPEQIEGRRGDPRSDVYALGCSCFRC